MTHQIIKTEEYLLVVDDSEIKNGYAYNPFGDCPILIDNIEDDLLYINFEYSKIIAHRPLNNASFLEGVDVLPSLEDDVEKLGIERAIERRWHPNSLETRRVANEIITAVSYGFNKAREKYKYTEEDVRNAIQLAWEADSIDGIVDLNIVLHYGDNNDLRTKWSEDEIIQSLSQPKIPVEFECEMKFKQMPDFHKDEPKTTTNSQGQTQWVGKYIYA